jgi:hypothetical protein
MPLYDLEPRVSGEVRLGSDKGENVIWAGRLAERGRSAEKIIFDASDNFIAFEVGKRGSGKSYGMGSMLEAFATGPGSQIGVHSVPRGVLLIDPLDVHWTAIQPLRADGPPGLQRQHEVLTKWHGLSVEPINVRVFMPAGFSSNADPSRFQSYQLPVSQLDVADWAMLLDCDLVSEPRGQLLSEVYRKVTELGWQRPGRPVAAVAQYCVDHLVDCAENDEEITGFYHRETIRSVVQGLRAYGQLPLFQSGTGTPLTALVSGGVLSILCLGRLPAALRTVLTTVIVRRLRADRMEASHLRRRLALETLDDATRHQLEQESANHVPRTILALDEAQILLPASGSSSARKELEAYILEGRNHGLSLWMATQRPKGAISAAAVSQIDFFVVHRLSVKDDIAAVGELLLNGEPTRIKLDERVIDLPELIRTLSTGQAIFSSATSSAKRFVVGAVRPRVVAHGGEAF